MKKLFLAMLVATSFSYAAEPEALPVQEIKIQPEQSTDVVITPVATEPNIVDTLTDIEKANISDIYNKKMPFPQFEMGIRYYTGTNGLTVDYDKAIYWFSNSSKDEGNAKADMMLAAMYYQGQGFEKNTSKALSFYSRAGNRGLLDAQLILTGMYFFNAEFMNQEYANYWIYKAIGNSSEVAEALKSMILLNAEDYKAIAKLVPMYELQAKNNEGIPNFILGYLYFTGKGVKQSFEKSKDYLSAAAQAGNPVAIVMLEEIDKIEKTPSTPVDSGKQSTESSIKDISK